MRNLNLYPVTVLPTPFMDPGIRGLCLYSPYSWKKVSMGPKVFIHAHAELGKTAETRRAFPESNEPAFCLGPFLRSSSKGWATPQGSSSDHLEGVASSQTCRPRVPSQCRTDHRVGIQARSSCFHWSSCCGPQGAVAWRTPLCSCSRETTSHPFFFLHQ